MSDPTAITHLAETWPDEESPTAPGPGIGAVPPARVGTEPLVNAAYHGLAANGETAIVLPSGAVTITASATALFGIIAPTHNLFTMGKTVVRLCRTKSGQLVLDPLRPTAARSFFEQFARFFAWRSGSGGRAVLKPAVMPEDTAKAILECHVATEILPPINGLVNCPIITEVGGGALKICGKGYSEETGILVNRGEVERDIPLAEAITSLLDLLVHFDFQTPADKSRAMASFIAPALKMGGLLNGFIAVDAAEADHSQSGKTYRQKIMAALYGEIVAIVSLKESGVGGVDESFMEKLVNGRPFIQFDNCRGHLDSKVLEQFLTAESAYPCRIPGVKEIEVDPCRYFILLTSNGVETTPDLANRSSFIRIKKRPGVQFPDTLGVVRSRRPYYLGCIFSVVREWHRLGKPRTEETRHDFRDWCQTLDWIVQNIFGMAPLMDGHRGAQERVSDPVLTFLRRVAIEIERQDQLGEPMVASQIFHIAEDAGIVIPGMSKDHVHDEDRAKKVVGMKLGPLFKDAASFHLDGFVISRTESSRQRADGDGGNYTLKAYTVERVPQPLQQPQQPLLAIEK